MQFLKKTLKVYKGSFTRVMNAASGSVAYTGVGFCPKAVIFAGSRASSFTSCVSFTAGVLSEGGIVNVGDITPGNWNPHTQAVYLSEGAATSQYAALSSFDADGFTLDWTKVGAPGANTVTIHYLAIG